MRKKIVAGNWKMNKNFEEAIDLVSDIMVEFRTKKLPKDVTVIFAPPFPYLKSISILIDLPGVHVAAQNCHQQQIGAYTGEVSAEMIQSCGASFVIIGHSERRAYFKETDDLLAQKVDAALSRYLTPIFCCGEVLYEREKGIQNEVVSSQIKNALFHLNKEQIKKVVVAYEPVWAIGTGLTATSQQAQEMHAFIREQLKNQYGQEVADTISILYGGSCNAQNARELFANPDVDGGLIGGASLKAADFISIVDSF
jgi:triosephosphate isomerase (TIM)